ncbi:MAG: hypothetical protein COA84_02395 [Robiginitomaculum sp.]|nr:MAG: hypothetical protein COA84_02395 [Robiginitomaculum sp.]
MSKSQAPREPDPKMLELLVCPLTHGPLVYDRDACELVSKKAKLAFPIREGVPIMLVDDARKLDK